MIEKKLESMLEAVNDIECLEDSISIKKRNVNLFCEEILKRLETDEVLNMILKSQWVDEKIQNGILKGRAWFSIVAITSKRILVIGSETKKGLFGGTPLLTEIWSGTFYYDNVNSAVSNNIWNSSDYSVKIETTSSELMLFPYSQEVSNTIVDTINRTIRNYKTNSNQSGNDIVKQLKDYKELLDSGIITQEEFDSKKKELLK